MKYLPALLLTALLISCQSPVGQGTTSTVPSEKGVLSVSFPSGGRSLDFDYAKANSNYYEVVAYDATNAYYGRTTDLTQTVSIPLPAGTYNVVALAGYKTISNLNAVLFGSGTTAGVVVTTGATTSANITLTNITVHLTAPAAAQTCGTAFTFYAWGDLGASRLSFNPGLGYPRFTRTNSTSTNTITVVKDAAKTGSSWGATYTVPSSVLTGAEYFYLKGDVNGSGNNIYLNDTAMGMTKTVGAVTATTWVLPGLDFYTGGYYANSWDALDSDASMVSQFTFSVNWGSGTTAGGFHLGWGTANPN